MSFGKRGSFSIPSDRKVMPRRSEHVLVLKAGLDYNSTPPDSKRKKGKSKVRANNKKKVVKKPTGFKIK